MNPLWTTRDLDIAETLARRVPLLSILQIAGIWWPEGPSLRVIHRRLRRIVEGGLIARTVANVSLSPMASMPLSCWTPGMPNPDFTALSALTRIRRLGVSVPNEVFFATKLSANLFGSVAGRLPELHRREHSVALGQVYRFYRKARPQEARHWIGQDARPMSKYRTLSPDAFIEGDCGRPARIVHRATRWDKHRVGRFHDHCAQSRIPYELW